LVWAKAKELHVASPMIANPVSTDRNGVIIIQ
jgi:hypothetical protein